MHEGNGPADAFVQRRGLRAGAAAVIRSRKTAWPRCDIGYVGTDRVDDLDADLASFLV
jgi:hypothetical protein